jgi:hypothetical protein
MSPFDIVKDSSVWYNTKSLRAAQQVDSILYTGTVRTVANDSAGELRYMVDVYYRGDTIPTPCRMMRRFGGVFNYEDVVLRGYNYNSPASIAAKAGDLVLVGLIGGQGREGIILGGLTHPTRKNLKKDSGPEYRSEFNGVETYINADGEYVLTFRGQPTNLAELDKDPQGPVSAPEYDKSVGTSYLKWDKTGSFTVSDNAESDPQSMHIDKESGTLLLTSGKVSLKMDKAKERVDAACKVYILSSPDIRLGAESATEQAVLGTTYRSQESQMHATHMSNLLTMGASLTSAGALLTAAAADPVLAGLAPAAATSIAGAAAAISIAAAQATAMATAISTLEASSALFLSSVVKVK